MAANDNDTGFPGPPETPEDSPRQMASGLYYIVWDDRPNDILKPTKGGWPHITVGYSAAPRSVELTQKMGVFACLHWPSMGMRQVVLDTVRVNSFTTGAGEERHDVLLVLSEKDASLIEAKRRDLTEFIPNGDFKFAPPHVTEGIYSTREEAERVAESLREKLPHTVTITGFTLD